MDKFFGLKAKGSNVRTEVIAGMTTFFTMAYIMFVNPSILSASGMSWGGVFVATILATAIGTLIMGFVANVPYAVAPGMGLNAFFAFTVCGILGFKWQEALAMVFICGLINVLITVTKVRKAIIKAIPRSLQLAIGGAVGLFIAYIGIKNAGFINFVSTQAGFTLGADAVPALEEMSAFFNIRADTYDSHMLDDLKLDEFYSEVADCFHQPVKRLLDLGCGTGLELDRLFERFPDVEVTGIDMSAGMLEKLKSKHQDKKLRLICGSYFDSAFSGPFDCVLSTYSLHHFSENSKLDLYKKVYAALESGGQFIFGDYTVSAIQRQQELLAANNAIRLEQGLAEECFYHFDIPFTVDTECRLMKEAGFRSAVVIRQWENTSIIQANK